jgi:hypothetical protein
VPGRQRRGRQPHEERREEPAGDRVPEVPHMANVLDTSGRVKPLTSEEPDRVAGSNTAVRRPRR